MLRPAAAAAVGLAAALGGCGAAAAPDDAAPPARLTGAKANPPASATAATLSRVPDGPAVRRRLAYANLTALAAAELPVPADRIAATVLGRRPRGVTGQVSVPAPQRDVPGVSAITPQAVSAVQSCLGDTLAQTILGPGTMGRDAAVGAGLATADGGPRLRVCGAPHYARHLRLMVHELREDVPRIDAGEQEIGERQIVAASVPARAVPRARLLAVLSGGAALRALGWR